MSERNLLVALSNSLPDRDDEFNAWYTDVHIVDITHKLTAYESGQRFENIEAEGAAAFPYRYLALYEITEGALDAAREEFAWQRQERADAEANGREAVVPFSEALDRSRLIVGFFSSISAQVIAPGVNMTS